MTHQVPGLEPYRKRMGYNEATTFETFFARTLDGRSQEYASGGMGQYFHANDSHVYRINAQAHTGVYRLHEILTFWIFNCIDNVFSKIKVLLLQTTT